MPSCTFQFRAFSQSTDSYDSLSREELKSRLAHLHQVPDVQNSEFENFKFKAALLFATISFHAVRIIYTSQEGLNTRNSITIIIVPLLRQFCMIN